MQRALVEVALLGLAGGALGCWVVLYGLSYSAESLAHALFPGLVVAALIGRAAAARRRGGARRRGAGDRARARVAGGRARHRRRRRGDEPVRARRAARALARLARRASRPAVRRRARRLRRRPGCSPPGSPSSCVALRVLHGRLLAVGFDRASARALGVRRCASTGAAAAARARGAGRRAGARQPARGRGADRAGGDGAAAGAPDAGRCWRSARVVATWAASAGCTSPTTPAPRPARRSPGRCCAPTWSWARRGGGIPRRAGAADPLVVVRTAGRSRRRDGAPAGDRSPSARRSAAWKSSAPEAPVPGRGRPVTACASSATSHTAIALPCRSSARASCA